MTRANRPVIDYYFWMNSDWAYLGADRLDALARRQGVEIRHKPVNLPEVYARTGACCWGNARRSGSNTASRNWRGGAAT